MRQAASAMPDQLCLPGCHNTGPGRTDQTFQEPKPPWAAGTSYDGTNDSHQSGELGRRLRSAHRSSHHTLDALGKAFRHSEDQHCSPRENHL